MPLITYEGPDLTRGQRVALIREFTWVAHQVVPDVPKGTNYVIIKDIGKGEGEKMMAKGDRVLMKSEELDALKERLDRLERNLAFSTKANKILTTALSKLKVDLDLVADHLGTLNDGVESVKEEVARSRIRTEEFPIVFSLLRLLSLPDLEKHKDTVFPFVRKLMILHKKMVTGRLEREEVRERFADIIKDVQTELKKRDIEPPLLSLPF